MSALKDDILSLIRQAEKEYSTAVKSAVDEAEEYVVECRKILDSRIEDLKREWYLFAKTENEKFLNMLSEEEQKMEQETREMKERLKKLQISKADLISSRIKEEVLSLYGNSKDGEADADL
jgi:hypothetical protein